MKKDQGLIEKLTTGNPMSPSGHFGFGGKPTTLPNSPQNQSANNPFTSNNDTAVSTRLSKSTIRKGPNMSALNNCRNRNQSFDFRNNSMSATMGIMGMKDKNAGTDNKLFSPRSVISGAREQMMGNTVRDGLSINATRKEGWGNPYSTAKNCLSTRHASLSVKDIVDNMVHKKAFGMDYYEPKAFVKDLLPVHTHVRSKELRRTFVEDAIIAKDKVPA